MVLHPRYIFIALIFISLSLIILHFDISHHILVNSTNIPQSEEILNQTEVIAFIISADCRSLRYNTTKANLERAFPKFFTIRCFPCIPLNDSRIHTSNVLLWRKFSSNLLAFVDLWTNEIPRYSQHNEYQWSFIFEDDVNIGDPSFFSLPDFIAPLEELMYNREVREKDGFFYLGICGPNFINEAKFFITNGTNKSLSSQRGYGYCLHATAITAKRSRSLWGEIASYRPNPGDLALDSQFRTYCIRSRNSYYTFGSNIHYPPNTGHYGVVYQDRGRFPSTI